MAVRRILPLAIGLVLLAGCGENTPAQAAALKGPVRYAKSGGIAGVVQNLTIRPDGSGVAARYDRRRAFRLPATRRRAVEKAVRQADLARTKSPPKEAGGADAFDYGVSYLGHAVSWSDFTADPPARVERLYALLDDIFERYAPHSS